MPFVIEDLGYSGAGGDIYEYWDAEDGTRAAGGVASWASLSPTALAPAQATGALQPDYSAVSFNDWRPGITGDGTSKYLRSASLGNLPTGATECEIWALIYQPHLGSEASTRIVGAWGGVFSTQRTDVRRSVTSGVNRCHGATGSGSAEQTRVNSSVDFSGYKLVRYRRTGASPNGQHETYVDGVASATTTGLTFNISSSGNVSLFANTNSAPPAQYAGFTISFFLVTKPLDSTKAANVKAFADARVAALSFAPTRFESKITIDSHEWSRSSHDQAYAIQDNTLSLKNHQRFEVRDGDYAWFDDTARNRAEMQSSVRQPFETDIWTSCWLRVRAGDPIESNSYNLLGQFHASADTGDTTAEPPFAMNLRLNGSDEVIRFIRRYATTDPTYSGDVTQVNEYDTAPIVRDRWYRVVARHRFSYAGTGALEIWWDGNPTAVVSQTNINYGYHDADGPYYKYGIYRSAQTGTLVVEIAKMEVKTTSLSSRVASPLPLV